MHKLPPHWEPGADPIEITPDEHIAIRMMFAGKADEGMQQAGMRAIVEKVCALYHNPFRDNPRENDYVMGMQDVGRRLVRMTKVAPQEKGHRNE